MAAEKMQIDFRRAIMNEFGLDYAILGEIYTEKMLWQFQLQNYTDRLGIAQRVCKDVANILLSTPVKITTPNDRLNEVIEQEVFGRLGFNSIFSQNLPYFLGLGDGLLTAYRDNIDGKPAINYIPIYNVIPICYNNHTVSKLVWFNETKIDNRQFVICVIEELERRTIKLFEVNSERLMVVDYGTPLWIKIMGKNVVQEESFELNPTKKFAWVSTGLFNARWMNTPFHNGLCWPWWLIRKCEWSWNLLQEEYEASKKKIFINKNMVKIAPSSVEDPLTGIAQPVKHFDWNSQYYEVADLGEEQIHEYNPQVRLSEFRDKFAFDLQLLGLELGLGAEFYTINHLKVEQTATQVILQHRDAYNTINVIKQNLVPAIQTIIFGLMDYWFEDGLLTNEDVINPDTGQPIGLWDIGVTFDDGVFINRGAKVTEGLNIYDRQLLDKRSFWMDYAGYSKAKTDVIMRRLKEDMLDDLELNLQMNALTQMLGMGEEQSNGNEQGGEPTNEE